MATPRQSNDETLRFLRLIWQPGEVRELRVPKHNAYGHTASGYFDTLEALTEAAAAYDGRVNIFFTLNPVLPDLRARALNRMVERAENTTADLEIQKRRWLFLDIDPDRPSGISSTDQERQAAQAVLNAVVSFLTSQGWPAPVTAMSGNGYYALHRIDLPNDPSSAALLKGVLGTLAARFDSDAAHIDTGVYNAARIIGLIGTLKVKGDETPDRPHRRSRLISVPEALIAVDQALLRSLLPEEATGRRERAGSGGSRLLREILDEHGIEYREQPPDANGVIWYHVRRCPFHEDGRDFECGVGQEIPDGPFAGHCFHNRGAGKGWREWKAALRLGTPRDRVGPARPEEAPVSDLPTIVGNDRHLHEIVADAWSALTEANSPARFFVHGNSITELVPDDEGRPVITHLTAAALRGRLDRCALWHAETDNGTRRPAPPPREIVDDMMALEKPLPVIKGVIGAPVFAKDGSLVGDTGYQPRTRLYYFPVGEPVPSVPEQPDATDLQRARQLLALEWLADFPFVDDASRAHAIAVPLTVLVREMIDGPTPLFAFDAPAAGTGKGLLASSASLIASGFEAAMMTETRDEEEMRKRVTSILCAGPSVVTIDNIKRRLSSATLASLLTTTSWRDRILGRSQMIDVPSRAVWMVTGNNIQMSDEITRRTAWIRQDARRDRPWDREGFRHPDLPGWVRRHRHEVLWALLVLAQNWVAKGCQPWAGKPLGSFESWSWVIGGILEAAGIGGFLANRADLYRRLDQETEQWRGFVRAWWGQHGGKAVKAAELLPLALEHIPDLFERTKETDRAQKTALGKALGERRDRLISEWFLRQAGEDGHAKGALWRLEHESEAEVDAEVPPQNGQPSASHPQENGPISDSNAEDAELAEVVSGVIARGGVGPPAAQPEEAARNSHPHLPQHPQTDSKQAHLEAEGVRKVAADDADVPRCRGGCGKSMPPGQTCFECAARDVQEWARLRKRRRTS